MSSTRYVRLVLCAVLACAGIAGGRVFVRVSIDEARERWSVFSQEERQRLVGHYREFQKLPPDERRELLRRGEQLSAVETEIVEELEPGERAKLERLDAMQRRSVLRRMLETELTTRGRRVREELDETEVMLLEELEGEERAQFAREIERQRFAYRGRILGERLGFEERELDELDELGLDEVEVRFREIQRAYVRGEIERDGLPDWLSEREWKAIDALPDTQFPGAWKRVLRRRAEIAPQDPLPDQPFEELREALRPDPAWHLELEHLAETEREELFAERIRERTVAALTKLGIGPNEIDFVKFASLRGLELNLALRQEVQEILRAHQAAEY